MEKHHLNWSLESDRKKVVKMLQRENVVLAPSDTVLGLFSRVSQGGFIALQSVKKRTDKPFLLLVSSLDQFLHFSAKKPSEMLQKLLDQAWPGPLTVIVPAKKNVPAYMCSDAQTIAIRIPQHAYLQEILSEVGPLFSTSANKPGKQVPQKVEEVDEEILQAVDGIVQGDAGAVPSTIVDCSGEQPKIIREGYYSRRQLESFYGSSFE